MNKLEAKLKYYNDKNVPDDWDVADSTDFHVGFVYGIRKALHELVWQKRYWYKIGVNGEDCSEGWLKLTEDEAKLLSFASNKKHWAKAIINRESDEFYIDLKSKRDELEEEE